MDVVMNVKEYSPEVGLHLVWDEEAGILVTFDHGEVRVRGNASGLRTLARHLLTLAQAGVPSGSHVHLDDLSGLEDDSVPVVLERDDRL
ncbi:Imm32 family immunity protein [Microtetraspora niveoalba]|uniref:Imm32 family immunity protein n=1 Tax=Microtetraspora niveoalba TaxID=46175 RepID=UPI00082F5A58|nr:hypothetical protein [Microtetraspora niveoalba]